jgi:hypothetical protein
MADLTLASANLGATPKPPMPQEPARTILALDLGTTTGWALRSHDGLITSGTVSFRPGRFDGGGMRYLRFTNWLTSWTGCPGLSPRSGSRRSGPTGAWTRATSLEVSSRR